jgi:hypothetical protein
MCALSKLCIERPPGTFVSVSSVGRGGEQRFTTDPYGRLAPNYPNRFLNVSVPAGAQIQFKFIKVAADGTVTWENGMNHRYTVPAIGTGYVNVNWQN